MNTNDVVLSDTYPETSSGAELAPVDLDPPSPELARWQELSSRNSVQIEHDGDAEKMMSIPRPAWSDPDWDQVGESVQRAAYTSASAFIAAKTGAGFNRIDSREPAQVQVYVSMHGAGTKRVQLRLIDTNIASGSASPGTGWSTKTMALLPEEALELANVLRAAVDLLETE